jgi:CheY-like chemotaxis protein
VPWPGRGPVGATDVTPQVLAMLAAKPQIILFGLVPGTDSITAIRAIRAQNPNIPISECSACELPSFIAAAGGAPVMHNIYYENISQVLAAMETIAPDGTVTLYNA